MIGSLAHRPGTALHGRDRPALARAAFDRVVFDRRAFARVVLAALVVLSVPLAVAVPATPAYARQEPGPLLVVLTETGTTRDGVPVLRRHPRPEPVLRLLGRGFSARMLRWYRAAQVLWRGGDRAGRAEPAYLLLSGHDGGFGRRGFYLREPGGDVDLRDTGYVDLPAGSAPKAGAATATGRFGAIDQLFPHELLHVIVERLTGPPPAFRSNQIHEVGTVTDRRYAFNEGLAEAMQVLAVDDPDADPATRALRGEAGRGKRHRLEAVLGEYRAALTARAALAPPTRLGFMLWYGQLVQVQRYFTVRENGFARQPDLPENLLRPGDPFGAHLLDNMVPGTPGAPPRPPARLVATEGVVSHLMWRWLTDPAIGASRPDGACDGRLGVGPTADPGAAPDPLDNAASKLLAVLADRRPADVVALVTGYRAACPGDAAAVDRVVAEALAGQALPVDVPELWLVNRHATVGNSVLDQYRAQPRPRVFDLNAASVADLLGVPGVDRRLAGSIVSAGPYRRVDDLGRVPGVTPRLLGTFRDLAAAGDRRAGNGAAASGPAAEDGSAAEDDVDPGRMIRSYLLRVLGFLLLAALAAAGLHRLVRRCTRRRALLVGSVAALLGTLPAWLRPAVDGAPTGVGAALAVCLVPPLAVAVPAVALDLCRHRDPRRTRRTAMAWLLALLPALAVTQSWY